MDPAIQGAENTLRNCDMEKMACEDSLMAAIQATNSVEQKLREMRLQPTMLALREDHELRKSAIAESGLDDLDFVCDMLSKANEARDGDRRSREQALQAFQVPATRSYASAYASLPEVPESLSGRLAHGANARLSHMLLGV